MSRDGSVSRDGSESSDDNNDDENWELTPDELRRLDRIEEAILRDEPVPEWDAMFAGIDWYEEELKDLYQREVRRLVKVVDDDDGDDFFDHIEAWYGRGSNEQQCAEAWMRRLN